VVVVKEGDDPLAIADGYPLEWVGGNLSHDANSSFCQTHHRIKSSLPKKMATADSVSVFAEGTFEDQVRAFRLRAPLDVAV
jgi:hypothetical protein